MRMELWVVAHHWNQVHDPSIRWNLWWRNIDISLTLSLPPLEGGRSDLWV